MVDSIDNLIRDLGNGSITNIDRLGSGSESPPPPTICRGCFIVDFNTSGTGTQFYRMDYIENRKTQYGKIVCQSPRLGDFNFPGSICYTRLLNSVISISGFYLLYRKVFK